MEGPIGAGKTHAVAQKFLASEDSRRINTRVEIVAGNPFEKGFQAGGFSVWSTLIHKLKAPGSFEEQITEALKRSEIVFEKSQIPVDCTAKDKKKRHPDLSQLHLLNPILGTEFAFDTKNKDMRMQCDLNSLENNYKTIEKILIRDYGTKAKYPKNVENELAVQKIITLLAAIVAGMCAKGDEDIIAIFDDTNSMNSLSWLVTLELTKWWSATRILMILSLRSILYADAENLSGVPISARKSYKDEQLEQLLNLRNFLVNLPNVEVIELLPKGDYTLDVIKHARDVKDAPALLVNFLKQKTNGNPLFIVDALKQFEAENMIKVKKHVAVDGQKQKKLVFVGDKFHKEKKKGINVPISVESVCGMLLDSLSITQQIALKVAAIIGTENGFSLKEVKMGFPIKELEGQLNYEWDLLVNAGIIIERETSKDKRPSTTSNYKETKIHSPDSENFKFQSEWMKESIVNRMMYKQREDIINIFLNAQS